MGRCGIVFLKQFYGTLFVVCVVGKLLYSSSIFWAIVVHYNNFDFKKSQESRPLLTASLQTATFFYWDSVPSFSVSLKDDGIDDGSIISLNWLLCIVTVGQVIILNWAAELMCFIIYVCIPFSLIQLNKWLQVWQKFALTTRNCHSQPVNLPFFTCERLTCDINHDTYCKASNKHPRHLLEHRPRNLGV